MFKDNHRAVVVSAGRELRGTRSVQTAIDATKRRMLIRLCRNMIELMAFAHDEDGLRVVAESDPTGADFRWLHQISVAPLGPNGEIEIAVVKTLYI